MAPRPKQRYQFIYNGVTVSVEAIDEATARLRAITQLRERHASGRRVPILERGQGDLLQLVKTTAPFRRKNS